MTKKSNCCIDCLYVFFERHGFQSTTLKCLINRALVFQDISVPDIERIKEDIIKHSVDEDEAIWRKIACYYTLNIDQIYNTACMIPLKRPGDTFFQLLNQQQPQARVDNLLPMLEIVIEKEVLDLNRTYVKYKYGWSFEK